ncbi:MAG: hypothetical protein Q4C80_06825 [Bacillota bacterium]|nr:hypothetical protein [Bacillota bacterium]
MNIFSTCIAVLILVVILFLAIRHLVKVRKRGGCVGCPNSSSCCSCCCEDIDNNGEEAKKDIY